jgi:F-box protein 9
MDASVDKTYKNKHFPASSFPPKPSNLNHPNTSTVVPYPACHPLQGPQASTAQLIEDFANLSITPAPPPSEGSPPPACPVSVLPSEILVEVLVHAAIADVASFVRLAQVCKRFAYLVATEERVWKRVCCGAEFGFGAMLYDYRCSILGEPLLNDNEGYLLTDPLSNEISPTNTTPLDTSTITLSLLHTTYASSWRSMFQTRPRIRFSGVYISTVNYVRPGASSANHVSWNTPVHIVTYYRYLRFFRDGTVLSLLTVAEPADVVQHLTKDNATLHSAGAAGALPSTVVKHALRGRWRLSGPASSNTSTDEESEGGVHIETEGVDEKYFYKLHLSIRSASSASNSRKPKGNKLVWKGFWSYNRLTDDWAEFGLRNDRPFFWSRVRSYGL